VHLSQPDIGRFASTGTGVAHCPTSNMRLASGIAPIPALRHAGVNVGLGVDGSASNDGSHLLAEARQALLLQRIAPERYGDGIAPGGRGGFAGSARAMSAREALTLATRGGAAVLGRDDIGQLAPGMAADFIAVNLNRIGYSGAWHDPLAALVLCQPASVDFAFINGRAVVEHGRLTTLDPEPVRRRHSEISLRMLRGETIS
jgi:cytosine/adenosine deaminase-related metal-dependent hydrolase